MLRRVFLLLWLFALAPAVAFARPGGGHSYSGGGSHSSGGGGYHSSGGSSGGGSFQFSSGGSSTSSYSGSSDGDPVFVLIVILVVIAWVVIQAIGNAGSGGAREWSTSSTSSLSFPVTTSGADDEPRQLVAVSSRALERLRKTDPDFSIVLFEDFLYAL